MATKTVVPTIPAEVAAKLAALETTDEILSDKRAHSPARLDQRRNELRDLLLAQWRLDQSSLKAQAINEAAAEIAAFVDAMHTKHDPDLAEIESRRADAMKRKAAALDEIRRLKALCDEMDQIAAECIEHRGESAKLLAVDLAQWPWSKTAVPTWNGAVDVLESVCQTFGLQFKPAAAALHDHVRNGRKKNFKAAIVAPFAFNHGTFRE